MIKQADKKDTDKTKSIAMGREFFTPFSQKWFVDFEYVKNHRYRCTNLGVSFYHSPDTFTFFAFSCF